METIFALFDSSNDESPDEYFDGSNDAFTVGKQNCNHILELHHTETND